MAAAVKININAFGTGKTKADIAGVVKQLQKLNLPIKSITTNTKGLRVAFAKTSDNVKKFDKSARDASFSIGHMVARSVFLVAVLGAVFGAVAGIQAAFRKAFDAVEKYTKQVAGLTAVTLSFMKVSPGKGLAEQYLRARNYAKGLYRVIEDIAAQTLLTGQHATLMARTFLENGVVINTQNQEQIQGLKSIANALAIVTEGQAKERQIRSEINSLLKGRIRATESLGKLLLNIDPQLREHLKIWKQQGTVIENISRLLKGFDATTGDIATTWEAVSTTIATTADRVLRGAFKPVYEDILKITKNINAWLEKNRAVVDLKMRNAYEEIKRTIKDAVSVLKTAYDVVVKFGDMIKLIAEIYIAKKLVNAVVSVGTKTVAMLKAVKVAQMGTILGLIATGVTWVASDIYFNFKNAEENAKKLQNVFENFKIDVPEKDLKDFASKHIKLFKDMGVNAKEILSLAIEEGILKTEKITRKPVLFPELRDPIEETKLLITNWDKMNALIKEFRTNIHVPLKTLKEYQEAAREVGVEFDRLTLRRILKDIPLLEGVSAKTFSKIAKGIMEIPASTELASKKIFVLAKEFEKLLIPEFEVKIDPTKFEGMLEKIFMQTQPAFDRIETKAANQAKELYDAFLEFPENQRKKYEAELDLALEQIREIFIRKQNELANRLERDIAESEATTLKLGLTTALDKEAFDIKRKYDKLIENVENKMKQLKEKFAEDDERYEKAMATYKKETKALETEKQKQLDIFETFTIKSRKLQQKAETLGVKGDIIQTQQEINKLRGDEQKIIQGNINAIKIERDIKINALKLAINQLNEEISRNKDIDGLLLKRKELLTAQMAEEKKLFNIKQKNEEMMKTESGAFQLGVNEILREYSYLAEQAKQLGTTFITNITDTFGTFFNDIIKGEMKSFRDYMLNFIYSLGQEVSKLLSQQLVLKIFGSGLGTGGTKKGWVDFIIELFGYHKGGLVPAPANYHKGGLVPAFANYHNGGLAPDERVAVLQTGERVLTQKQETIFAEMVSTLSQIKNQRATQDISVVNVLDESVVESFITSGRGKKVIKNIIQS